MCGIFGIFGRVDKELVNAMSDILKHRGPDDSGFFVDDGVALGNRRLSIIDLAGGHQPVHNEDSTLWITFNGEIYNFQELRPRLEKLGHNFYTTSDTEVIIHAYEEWGEDCVKELNGMWAFAIWDSNRKRLFLSRDRLGIKPLYYFSDGTRFIFASEIKAILLDRSIPRTPNDKMIYEYLVYGFADHTEQTFFSQVYRLLPAHNLTVDENGVQTRKYWDITFVNKEIEGSKTDDAYAEHFRELLEDSIKLQLVSEVPLGTCLSGGLDSSSIVCMINQLLSLNRGVVGGASNTEGYQKTFTVYFEDKQIDEREYVEEVIAKTKTERNLFLPSSKQFWDDIEKLVYFQEEPFVSSSVYAQWCVMKLASQKVKVVLDGQGGDELLAGYIGYHLVLMRDLWKEKRITSLMKELLFSLDIILPYITHYTFWSRSKRTKKMTALLNGDFVSEFACTKRNDELSKVEELPILMYGHLTKYNLPALLRYEDKNSMAFSVEARVPFLDHRLVEYVFSLPLSQKLKNGWTKRILRNAMKGIVPEKVRARRKKTAFATPQEAWLKDLQKEVREVLSSLQFRDRKYFKQQQILKEFDALCSGRSKQYHDIIWRILNLEMWLRVFIDKKSLRNVAQRV